MATLMATKVRFANNGSLVIGRKLIEDSFEVGVEVDTMTEY